MLPPKGFDPNKTNIQLMNWLQKIAMPFSSESWDNLHGHPLGDRLVYVYHGTSSGKLLKALQHGSLDPQKSSENKSWQASSPGIFVARSYGFFSASMYAYHAANDENTGDQTQPVVLMLQIPYSWIDYDPDDVPKDKLYNTDQGVVRRPIPIKNIVGILYFKDNDDNWKWTTTKEFFNLLNKTPNLPPAMQQLLQWYNSAGKQTYRRNVKWKHEPEEVLAISISAWMINELGASPQQASSDKIMDALINNHINFYTPVMQALNIATQAIGESFNPEELYHKPQPYDNILSYLRKSDNLISNEL